MENGEKKKCEESCKHEGSCCGSSSMSCHGFHGGVHYLVKMVLALVIFMLIFCFGFRLGEITGSIKGAGYGRGDLNDGGYRMMRGYKYPSVAPNANTIIPGGAQ